MAQWCIFLVCGSERIQHGLQIFNPIIVKPVNLMEILKQRIKSVKNRFHQATKLSGRSNDSVILLAVSKTRSAEELIRAYCYGQRHFGENYLQEALQKQRSLANYLVTWHFIGPIQSNKTREIAANFSWVHSIDRLKIAKRLNDQRPRHLPPLNVCIQVNISQEPAKSGVLVGNVLELVTAVSELPRLRIRGLMTIPSIAGEFEAQRRPFRMLRELMDKLDRFHLDTLSMGMSGDFEAAIAEGATIVRIGTAVFGPRSQTS